MFVVPRAFEMNRLALSLMMAGALASCGGGSGSGSTPGTGSDDSVAVSADEARTTTLLDKKAWRFVQDDALTDDAALASDGSAWSSVTLPHTWNEKDAASIVQTTPTS